MLSRNITVPCSARQAEGRAGLRRAQGAGSWHFQAEGGKGGGWPRVSGSLVAAGHFALWSGLVQSQLHVTVIG